MTCGHVKVIVLPAHALLTNPAIRKGRNFFDNLFAEKLN